MYSLVLSRGAQDDLEQLWADDEVAAAAIDVLLQEVQGNQHLLDMLTAHDFGAYGTERFHVSRWVTQQRQDRNLWRLKLWDLERQGIRYRVVYALDQRRRYHVLGIVHRDFNYDPNDECSRRILAEYDDLDIPSYR